ncbi:hypothetical protein D6817_02305 [Candidatus Pacearchaeota archaeon]|nr:MAG: hypothetical protein D6817_02305 [Candidatus Pacearchaeota archaeon]
MDGFAVFGLRAIALSCLRVALAERFEFAAIAARVQAQQQGSECLCIYVCIYNFHVVIGSC